MEHKLVYIFNYIDFPEDAQEGIGDVSNDTLVWFSYDEEEGDLVSEYIKTAVPSIKPGELVLIDVCW